MEIGVRRIVRETLRTWVGVGVQVCVGGSSSGRERGRIGRRAVLEGGIVIILGVVRINLRRSRGFAWNGGAKVNVSLVVGMCLAIGDAVRDGVNLVDIGLARSI